MELTVGYLSCNEGFLTRYLKQVLGQCQVDSLTGAVASEKVTEALKGHLRTDGNRSKSVKAKDGLTER